MRRKLLFAILLFVQASVWSQPQLLDGFSHEWLDLEVERPVDITFDDYGRMMVWEKGGKVWYVIDGEKAEEPLLDISDEVGNYGDMGLLGFTIDPNFKTNGYIYAFYVVDFYHLMFFGTADYNPETNLYWRPTVTRCTRYTIKDIATNPTVDYDSRKVLLGEGPGLGASVLFIAHIGCGIDFGDDGTLLLSTGDGHGWEGPYFGEGPPYFGNYIESAIEQGFISSEEEVGILMAQQKESLNGKILRIDPETGEGVPSNPYYDPSNPNSNESKVWALGFRNPFKLKIRPGSGLSDPSFGVPGVAYVGEVGDGLWEELNIVRKGGENFGWPIYEGIDEYVNFPFEEEKVNPFAINPLFGSDGCDTEFFKFEDLLHQASKNELSFKNPCGGENEIPEDYRFVHSRPDLNLAHSTAGFGVFFGGFDDFGNSVNLPISHPDSPIEGDFSDLRSRCMIGGDFYNGNSFPDEYEGAYFFGDYNEGWINYLEYDLNDSITAIKPFFRDTFPIVGMSVNPNDGCLYVINHEYGFSRICFGDNLAPKAVINQDIDYGTSPLTVNFDAAESFDPQGENITVEWDFRDGATSSEFTIGHTFVADNNDPQSFEVSLTVTDEVGQTTKATTLVSVNNTPPVVNITSVSDGDVYNLTGISEINLDADVIDLEHSESELSYDWIWSLHHNTHMHAEPTINEVSSVVNLIPAGCEEEVFFYGLELTVEDASGLKGRDEVFLYPDCGNEYLELLTFRAQLIDSETHCSWLTLDENDVSHYEIERAIGQGQFNYLGTVQANNGTDEQSYSFVDENVWQGVNFYRLKMVSNSGVETYSDQRLILYANPDEIFVFPNPVIDDLSIFYGNLNNEARVDIFNVEGKLIRKFEIEGNGSQVQKVNLKGVNPGHYIYRIQNGELMKTGRFIKAR